MGNLNDTKTHDNLKAAFAGNLRQTDDIFIFLKLLILRVILR
ncbi:MAG: hypothetical protein CM1200mP28_07480 [Deltaproteobacteria bacterium]|nr:MAG: hypothetical protein CM1200mP28_07480 [Deltaproteobacteria bacterium]